MLLNFGNFKIKRSTILFALVLCCNQAQGYEPNLKDVLQSIKESKVVFVGRIVGMKEIERNEAEAVAVLNVKQIRCIHATACKPGRNVKIRYVSQSHVERLFPVSFPLSVSVLFAIHTGEKQHHLLFNSVVGSEMDNAFKIEDSELGEDYLDGPTVSLVSIFLDQKRESITWSKLESMTR